ncbi:hypothetical protein HanHA300_Chr15g0579701 [Helianthus annuus]|nr:hypothetical protein HanHA300_Chr15g0579701 [Helianthus annuus]KAJ0649968.1 hypothetical protein HanLR1_Chr15g0590341 [Helianthus annuus]
MKIDLKTLHTSFFLILCISHRYIYFYYYYYYYYYLVVHPIVKIIMSCSVLSMVTPDHRYPFRLI